MNRTVGRYEVLREVGRGGMSIVHLARQQPLERFVAVKELRSAGLSDASAARRFLRESRLAGSLSHPNIVTVHDYFEYEGIAYIAMEYLARGSLRPWVGQLSSAESVGVLMGVLSALAAAERHRIVHRDLKPENIMVTTEGTVKIADFGIARALGNALPEESATATGMTIGTPSYMAPEQALAQEIGPWTDLYSTGVIAFELLSGRLPFIEPVPAAMLMKHINEEAPSLASVASGVEPELSEWVGTLLAKEPSERPQSALLAGEELEELALGLFGPRWRRDAAIPPDATPPTSSFAMPSPTEEIRRAEAADGDAGRRARPSRRGRAESARRSAAGREDTGWRHAAAAEDVAAWRRVAADDDDGAAWRRAAADEEPAWRRAAALDDDDPARRRPTEDDDEAWRRAVAADADTARRRTEADDDDAAWRRASTADGEPEWRRRGARDTGARRAAAAGALGGGYDAAIPPRRARGRRRRPLRSALLIVPLLVFAVGALASLLAPRTPSRPAAERVDSLTERATSRGNRSDVSSGVVTRDASLGDASGDGVSAGIAATARRATETARPRATARPAMARPRATARPAAALRAMARPATAPPARLCRGHGSAGRRRRGGPQRRRRLALGRSERRRARRRRRAVSQRSTRRAPANWPA